MDSVIIYIITKCSFNLLPQVVYDADGFCEKNRDVLFKDCIALLKGSSKYVVIIGRPVVLLIT